MSRPPRDDVRISGICSMAMRNVLGDLVAAYAQRCGREVTIVSAGGVDVARRVDAGEEFDVVVLADEAIDALAVRGRVVEDTRTGLARCGVAIAVAAGTPWPDLRDEATVRDAVLEARSVGYSTGPSGLHVARLLERWGATTARTPRTVQAPPGVPVATLLVRGDVALGFQQLSELIDVPGVEVVGLLPPQIQAVTTFSGAVCMAATRPRDARSLLSYLASPDAVASKRRHGMEPA